MSIKNYLAILTFGLAFAACSEDVRPRAGNTQSAITRIPCQVQADCVSRGGECTGGQCTADNECASAADCAAAEACVADVNFGGLCAASGATPLAGPAWTCTADADCPTGQVCLSGTCGWP